MVQCNSFFSRVVNTITELQRLGFQTVAIWCSLVKLLTLPEWLGSNFGLVPWAWATTGGALLFHNTIEVANSQRYVAIHYSCSNANVAPFCIRPINVSRNIGCMEKLNIGNLWDKTFRYCKDGMGSCPKVPKSSWCCNLQVIQWELFSDPEAKWKAITGCWAPIFSNFPLSSLRDMVSI